MIEEYESRLDIFDEWAVNTYCDPGRPMEAYMKANGWKLITEDWLARRHRNGRGSSWMHQCANGKHWNLARKTDAGRVRCKECGKMLDEAPQMLLELQKMKGVR